MQAQTKFEVVFCSWIHTWGGGEGVRGRVHIGPPQANFKTHDNKNAIKPEIWGPPSLAIFPEGLDTPRNFGKNFRYPLPGFSTCVHLCFCSLLNLSQTMNY